MFSTQLTAEFRLEGYRAEPCLRVFVPTSFRMMVEVGDFRLGGCGHCFVPTLAGLSTFTGTRKIGKAFLSYIWENHRGSLSASGEGNTERKDGWRSFSDSASGRVRGPWALLQQVWMRSGLSSTSGQGRPLSRDWTCLPTGSSWDSRAYLHSGSCSAHSQARRGLSSRRCATYMWPSVTLARILLWITRQQPFFLGFISKKCHALPCG